MIKVEVKSQESTKVLHEDYKKNNFSYLEVVGTDEVGDCLLTTLIVPTKLVRSVEQYLTNKENTLNEFGVIKYEVRSYEIKDFKPLYIKGQDFVEINESKVIREEDVFINDFINVFIGTRNTFFSTLNIEDYKLNTLELEFYNTYLTTRIKYNHLKDDVSVYLKGIKYDS